MKLIATIIITVCCMIVGVSLMLGNQHRDCFLSHIEPCARRFGVPKKTQRHAPSAFSPAH